MPNIENFPQGESENNQIPNQLEVALKRAEKVAEEAGNEAVNQDDEAVKKALKKDIEKITNEPKIPTTAEVTGDKKEEWILNIRSVSELFFTLELLGDIKGSQKTYSKEENLALAYDFLNQTGEVDIKNITSTYGLRNKIAELAETYQPNSPIRLPGSLIKVLAERSQKRTPTEEKTSFWGKVKQKLTSVLPRN